MKAYCVCTPGKICCNTDLAISSRNDSFISNKSSCISLQSFRTALTSHVINSSTNVLLLAAPLMFQRLRPETLRNSAALQCLLCQELAGRFEPQTCFKTLQQYGFCSSSTDQIQTAACFWTRNCQEEKKPADIAIIALFLWSTA